MGANEEQGHDSQLIYYLAISCLRFADLFRFKRESRVMKLS